MADKRGDSSRAAGCHWRRRRGRIAPRHRFDRRQAAVNHLSAARFTEAEVIGASPVRLSARRPVAQGLARITRAEINLVSGNHLAGSSLSADEQKQVVAALAAGSLASRDAISSEVRRIGDRQFIGGAFPLFRDRATDTGHLVLLQDWAPTQAFLDELRASLILAGIGGFIIALAGGLVFSHRTSRPLMDIASAARDIAGGDWSRIVPARGAPKRQRWRRHSTT